MIAWLRRYLAGRRRSSTGPRFEWLADDAQWRSAAGYPLPRGHAARRRWLGHARRSTPATRPRAPRSPPAAPPTRVNVAIRRRAPPRSLGEPTLRLTYSGTRHRRDARVRPDRRRDAQPRARQPGDADPGHARRQPAHDHPPARGASRRASRRGSKYTLQLTGGTQVYGPVRATAAASRSARSHVELPRPPARPRRAQPRQRGRLLPGRAHAAASRRRFAIHLKRCRPHAAASARA